MHWVDRDEGATKTGKLKRVMMPTAMMLKKLAMMMVEGLQAMMMMEQTAKPDMLSAPLFLILFFSTSLLFCSFLFFFPLVGFRCWRWDGIRTGVGSAGMGLVLGSNWCSGVFYFFWFKMGEKLSLGLETGFEGFLGLVFVLGLQGRRVWFRVPGCRKGENDGVGQQIKGMGWEGSNQMITWSCRSIEEDRLALIPWKS